MLTCVALLLLTWCVDRSQATNRSVGYVVDDRHGNILIAEGYALADTETLLNSLYTTSVCNCRTACVIRPTCKAMAAFPVDDQFLCKLSDKGPDASDVIVQPNSTYIFWQDSLQHLYYKYLSDGFLYLVPTRQLRHPEARAYCAKIPGHRLAMFKTPAQRAAMNSIRMDVYKDLNIDLVSISNIRYWGDVDQVTPEEEASMLYAGPIYEGLFMKLQTDGRFASTDYFREFVCQANPNGFFW